MQSRRDESDQKRVRGTEDLRNKESRKVRGYGICLWQQRIRGTNKTIKVNIVPLTK